MSKQSGVEMEATINLKIDGHDIKISENDARQLQFFLNNLFGINNDCQQSFWNK